MNYRIYFDRTYTWISGTEDQPNGTDVFETLTEAKRDATAQLSDEIKALRDAVKRLKKLKKYDVALTECDYD